MVLKGTSLKDKGNNNTNNTDVTADITMQKVKRSPFVVLTYVCMKLSKLVITYNANNVSVNDMHISQQIYV